MARKKKRGVKQKVDSCLHVRQAMSSKTCSVLNNQFEDSYLAHVNGHAFDSQSAEVFYRDAYGAQLFQEDTLYIFVGTDSGLLPKFIQKQGVPEHSRYLFIEPSEIYEQVLSLFPAESHVQGIIVSPSDKLSETFADSGLSSYIHADKNLFFESVAAKEATFPHYQKLSATVQQEWIDRIWRTKVAVNQKTFIEKQLENLGENRISSICLKDVFKGQTAVLLGGGPSLDDALPWIKENRDKMVLLAISRVCRRLREVNLVPDIVFSVDPYPINFENSIDLLRFWEQTLFINAHHVSPQLLGQWRGKSVYSGPRFPWPTPLNEETLPLANPTVTNTALVSAVAMGFDRIILAGVDLCHSREGYTHSRGSNEDPLAKKVFESSNQVETNGGWLADTTPDYANAIAEFGLQAFEALNQGCRIFNSGPGAAVIENISYFPLESIELTSCIDPSSIIANVFPEKNYRQQVGHYNNCLVELQRGIESVQRLKLLINNEISKIDLLSINDRTISGGKLDLLLNLKLKIKTTFHDKEELIKKYSSGLLFSVDEENCTICEMKKYYNIFIETINYFLDSINFSIIKLQSRIEEINENPNIDIIFKQWDKDNSFGRAYILENCREKNLFPAAPFINVYKNLFSSLFETSQINISKIANIDPELVRLQLLELFQQKKNHRIERISQWLLELKISGLAWQLVLAETRLVLRDRTSAIFPFDTLPERRSFLPVNRDDKLFAYVLLSEENPPKGILLQWLAKGITYQATWGDLYDGWVAEPLRRSATDPINGIHVGALPETGHWVLLEVPVALFDPEIKVIDSFAVMIPFGQSYIDGNANWLCTGKKTATDNFVKWDPPLSVERQRVLGQGRDWLGGAPYDGGAVTSPGFMNAKDSFPVENEATLFVDLWLDPSVPPRELLLQWNAVGWGELKWHRAYWGENLLSVGVEGTVAQLSMGPIPFPKQPGWVRFQLPAALLDLEGVELSGLSVAHFDGVVGCGRVGAILSDKKEACWFDESLPKGAEIVGQGWGYHKEWTPEIKEAYQFSCALLAELSGDKVNALTIYNDMINGLRDPALLEEALKRILSLSLEDNDFENGLLALQCLSDLSVSYVPRYAKMLKIVGDTKLAIKTYEDYLDGNPQDLNSMLQLGGLYLDRGSVDAARVAVEYVLRQEPGNCEAQKLLEGLVRKNVK